MKMKDSSEYVIKHPELYHDDAVHMVDYEMDLDISIDIVNNNPKTVMRLVRVPYQLPL